MFNIPMLKVAISFVLAFLLPIQSASANDLMPPPSDVSCGITESGLQCSNGIIFTSNFTVVGTTSSQWFLWSLESGKSPTNLGNYVNQTIYATYPSLTGTATFSYDYLLNFLNGDVNGTALIGANVIHKVGDSTLANADGKKIYIHLPDLKNGMAKAKADADAAAKAKADADAAAKAKADADAAAKAKADADAAAALAKNEISNLIGKGEAELNVLLTTWLAKIVQSSGNLNNYKKIELKIRQDIKNLKGMIGTPKLTYFYANNLIEGNKILINNQLASIQSLKSIKCKKGSTVKTISASKPICPSGYKKVN